MMVPSSAQALTSRAAGMEEGSTTSEWYRVAWNGSGSPCITPRPS